MYYVFFFVSLGINQARRFHYSMMNEEFWLCMSKRKNEC
jgi:hypothetical protein